MSRTLQFDDCISIARMLKARTWAVTSRQRQRPALCQQSIKPTLRRAQAAVLECKLSADHVTKRHQQGSSTAAQQGTHQLPHCSPTTIGSEITIEGYCAGIARDGKTSPIRARHSPQPKQNNFSGLFTAGENQCRPSWSRDVSRRSSYFFDRNSFYFQLLQHRVSHN